MDRFAYDKSLAIAQKKTVQERCLLNTMLSVSTEPAAVHRVIQLQILSCYFLSTTVLRTSINERLSSTSNLMHSSLSSASNLVRSSLSSFSNFHRSSLSFCSSFTRSFSHSSFFSAKCSSVFFTSSSCSFAIQHHSAALPACRQWPHCHHACSTFASWLMVHRLETDHACLQACLLKTVLLPSGSLQWMAIEGHSLLANGWLPPIHALARRPSPSSLPLSAPPDLSGCRRFPAAAVLSLCTALPC